MNDVLPRAASPATEAHTGVPAEDYDPAETSEWVESLDSVVEHTGPDRARFLLNRVIEGARRHGVRPDLPLNTDYVNTIGRAEEPEYPGDVELERRIRRIIRWNAVAMVHRANKHFDGIGGHISTYASSATLYEVGFNHFFRGKDGEGTGDQIFYQGHASPGIYSRAFLEGRIAPEALDRFRREVQRGSGLSSYPHPRLMPGIWEFPTVSMGIGPISALFQARFNRYLHSRGLVDTSNSRVWCFIGDGECDEPETLGLISMAARERLDNLVFVINCNLQRLDGPVRGNGKIIQELESTFRGAGWNVVKVIWGPEWDDVLERDQEGLLRQRLNEVVDGQFQRYTAATGDYIRKDLFGTDPRLLSLVEHLSDEQIRGMRRGGHSYHKVYAAYRRATETKGRPTVVLAHTVKGWSLGEGFEGVNVTHQKKKLQLEELRSFRDLLELPISDDKLDEAPFFHPGMDSPEVQYVMERRRELGGPLPKRRTQVSVPLELPPDSVFDEFYRGMDKGQASTTMVFARLLSKLLRDKTIGKRVVPIIPDEARTFGMDALFSQVGIYASQGQLYEPIDKGKLLYYREAKDGQVLQEGISEAGAMASFAAAGTAYSVHDQPMIPFYIYYSMFGFQRVGDQIWAATDQMARGFLLGATAGRTTLNGEGLQHEDGHSHLLASAYPGVRAYDVAYAYELAVIVRDGLRRMFVDGERQLYYLTLHNEDYSMPAMPDGAAEGILKGIYRYNTATQRRANHVQLFGSGPMMNLALQAQQILAERYDVSADVWGVTSYTLLRADALSAERHNRLHPEAEPRVAYLTQVMKGVAGPFIACSDYVKTMPDMIGRWLPGTLVPLGTDGFGMSDTREELRRHFEVDAESIVVGALSGLLQDGRIGADVVARAIRDLGIDAEKLDPLSI
jgi:pyruvate dehydrogenase E1 component